MTDKQILRQAIIALLDDEHGISNETYYHIDLLCLNNGWEDIISKVENVNNRWFLNEDDAENLRKVLID